MTAIIVDQERYNLVVDFDDRHLGLRILTAVTVEVRLRLISSADSLLWASNYWKHTAAYNRRRVNVCSANFCRRPAGDYQDRYLLALSQRIATRNRRRGSSLSTEGSEQIECHHEERRDGWRSASQAEGDKRANLDASRRYRLLCRTTHFVQMQYNIHHHDPRQS